MSKIVGIGETVFDIIFRGNKPIKALPGGSVFNAMISLAHMGVEVEFVSETGSDRVGNEIIGFMHRNEMTDKYVMRYDSCASPLSIAFLNERNDAEYQFYKQRPENLLHIKFPSFSTGDCMVFGSFYAISPDTRPNVLALLDEAVKANAVVYYDPNFRASHVSQLNLLLPNIEDNMCRSTLVRGSDEDFRIIFGLSCSPEEIYQKKVAPLCPYFICTCAEKGVWLFTPSFTKHYASKKIEPVSTIGAGDNFNAGILYGFHHFGIQGNNLSSLSEKEWDKLISCAICFSSEVCQSFDNYIPTSFAQKFTF